MKLHRYIHIPGQSRERSAWGTICKRMTTRLVAGILLLTVLSLFPEFVWAQSPDKVAIVPFTIHSEKDLTFLKEGIMDMLASRLTWEGKVEVLDREQTRNTTAAYPGPVNEKTARAIGSSLGADYVLFGSLTIFGDSVSIDAKMVAVNGNQPAMAFFNQTRGMGEVIPRINQFATEINTKVFQRPVDTMPMAARAEATPSPATTSVPTPAAQSQSQPYDIHTHPEKIYQQEFGSGKVASGPAHTPQPMAAVPVETSSSQPAQAVPNPVFIAPEHQTHGAGFWKTRDFKQLFNGVALGDVDGDGKIETVVVLPHGMWIFRGDQGKFFQTGNFEFSRYKNVIGVDVGDINGNGVAEIFVTCLNAHKNGASSFVMEWNGSSLKPLVEDQNWYYRVVNITGRGDVLFAQHQQTFSENPFAGDIVEMAWRAGTYEPTRTVLTSADVNVLGFSMGYVKNDGRLVCVTYDEGDKIRILAPNGEQLWNSGERYGGSTLFFALPKDDPDAHENRKYLPMRLIVTDANADGKHELLVANNVEITGNVLQQFRMFTNATLESLSWQGMGMIQNWQTPKLSGHVRDFAIGDFDNDGVKELVAAIVIKEGQIIMTDAQSTLIAYDLK